MSGSQRGFGAKVAVGFAAVAVAVMVVGVSTLRAEARFQASAPLPMTVAAAQIRYDDGAVIEELFPGIVNARRESAVGFERGGRIDEITVDVGDRVEAGQILARLDMRALDAQIAAADAQTAEAAAQTALAADTQSRQAQLLERGHISRQRYDEVATSTQAAQARQNAAAAAADALRVQRDLSILSAPFNGVVTARHADEGAIAQPGAPVLQIVEQDALEIRVGLPPLVVARLSAGQAYPFTIDQREFRAAFRASTGVVDRQTRAVTALFDVEAPHGLSVGQIVRMQVETPIGADGFWVPTAALAESRRGLWSVYLLREEGDVYQLEPRVVETLRVEADRAFVRGAVEDGALILASGLQRVTPGQYVVPAMAEARAQ